MPVTIEPLDNGRILMYQVTPPWSVDEVLEAYRKMKVFLDNAPFKVQLLADLSRVGVIHAGALRARHTPFQGHPNIGKIATVTGNEVTRLLAESVIRLTRSDRVKLFTSPDEALFYLRQMNQLES